MRWLRGLVLAAITALGGAVVAEDTAKDYEIVSRLRENDSVVAVVRRNGVLYLLYDQTIIGAEFDDPDLRTQAAFPGFAIMQSAAYLDRELSRAIQIGLGIGTVPSFLRDQGIPTDVVEISDAVVRQAANYFVYERCEPDDPEECTNGETLVQDGLAFIEQSPPTPPYDLFTIDVYTGWNPVAFFVREVLEAVRDHWLRERGVLVLNFVGFLHGEHAAVPKSIYRTLQTIFPHVRAFREVQDATEQSGINIVFFASDAPITFHVPTTGEYHNPPANTYFDAVRNFEQWEIFQDVGSAQVEVEVEQGENAEHVSFTESASPRIQVLTKSDHGQEVFQNTHAATQEHMRQRIVEQFPTAMWNELGIVTTAE